MTDPALVLRRKGSPMDTISQGHTTLVALPAQLRRWGSASAGLACVLNGVWLACMIHLAGLGDTAAQVQVEPGVFRLSLGSCLVLTLLQVPILLAMAATAFERAPVASLIGGVVYALYVPLNLIGYFAFGRLAPLVYTAPAQTANAPLVASLIEIGGPFAITGILPVLGYGVLGLAWCFLAPGWAADPDLAKARVFVQSAPTPACMR